MTMRLIFKKTYKDFRFVVNNGYDENWEDFGELLGFRELERF